MSQRRRNPDFRSGPARDCGPLLRIAARGARGGGRYSRTYRVVEWTRRRREVTLCDNAPDAAANARRGRRSFAAAALGPALIGAVGGALLAPGLGADDGARVGPESAAASALARAAARPLYQRELPPLVPIGHPGAAARLAPASRPAPPFWISIPGAGVESPVDGLGATRRGLAVPELGRAGWWKGGARPGESGRAVIVGHLDSRRGPDVFARVPKLDRGDAIVIRDQVGESHRYAVVGVARVRKSRFPTDDVYGPASRPVLVLVTCGGPWDRARRHYRDNVLVYARAI